MQLGHILSKSVIAILAVLLLSSSALMFGNSVIIKNSIEVNWS